MGGFNDLQNVDFSKTIITSNPFQNLYVVLPLDLYEQKRLSNFHLDSSFIALCNDSKAHVFPGDARRLRNQFHRVISKGSLATLEDIDHEHLKYCYCVKSRMFGLTDYITAQFIEVNSEEPSCTIALFARRRKGMDFNSNKKRVSKLLTTLHNELGKVNTPAKDEKTSPRTPCSPI